MKQSLSPAIELPTLMSSLKPRLAPLAVAVMVSLAQSPVPAQAAGKADGVKVKTEVKALPPEIAKQYAHVPLPPDPKTDALYPPGKWIELFDGKSKQGWAVTDFAGGGEIEVQKDFQGKPALMLHMGELLTGLNFTNPVPKTGYEVELEVLKVDGSDFFCALTFPVGETHATLLLGGWGGAVTGISSIDGSDASENDTTQYFNFQKNKWFKVRLRVQGEKLEAWWDDEKIVNQDITGRRVHLRFGPIELSAPFGVATFQTTAAYRSIRLRRLPATK